MRFPGFEGEWETVRLGDIAFLQSGFAFESDFFSERGIKLVIPKNFTKDGYGNFHVGISKFSSEIAPIQYKCTENDLLLLLTDLTPTCELLGKPLLVRKEDGEVWLNQRIIRIDLNKKVLQGWLLYYFQTENYHKIIKETASGSTVRHSSNKIISNLVFRTPSTEEQMKIASLLSFLDSRIHTQSKIIEEIKLLKNTLSKKILNQELNINGNKKQSVWKTKKLQEVCEIVGGGTPETNKKEYWNGNIQWFTPTEIKSNFVSKSERTITDSGLKNSSAKILPKGAILLTTRATIGEAAVALEECATNQGFQSLIPKEGNDVNFLFNWIKQNKTELRKRANGSTFPEISKAEIEKIPINIPELEEQAMIGDFLSKLDAKIYSEKLILKKLEVQKTYLLTTLFI